MTEEKIILNFLRESNAIENVRDRRSLNEALAAWNFLMKHDTMSLPLILMTHKILMQSQPLEEEWRGHFRKVGVYIGRNEGLKWSLIPARIEQWIKAMNVRTEVTSSKGNKTLEFMSKQLHVEYESVHPFVDGNGRTGRMFMNWWRLRNGLRIYVVKESDRFKYYQWFKE